MEWICSAKYFEMALVAIQRLGLLLRNDSRNRRRTGASCVSGHPPARGISGVDADLCCGRADWKSCDEAGAGKRACRLLYAHAPVGLVGSDLRSGSKG